VAVVVAGAVTVTRDATSRKCLGERVNTSNRYSNSNNTSNNTKVVGVVAVLVAVVEAGQETMGVAVVVAVVDADVGVGEAARMVATFSKLEMRMLLLLLIRH
jgi:hypothetical protein